MLSEKQQEFLKVAIAAAQAVKLETGVIVSGQVSQAALESAWGAKAPRFNVFGMKMHHCPYVAGEQIFTTHEKGPNPVQEKFAAYNNLEDGFRCHALTLKHNFPQAYKATNLNDYTNSLTLDPTTKLSYAPYNKNYANEIINIANVHNLVELDTPPPPFSGGQDEQT